MSEQNDEYRAMFRAVGEFEERTARDRGEDEAREFRRLAWWAYHCGVMDGKEGRCDD